MGEEELEKLATSIRRFADAAYGATLVGRAPDCTIDFNRRMRAPQIGDLVIETSTVYRSRGTTDIDAVGYLEEVAREKVIFDDDPDFVWDETVEGQPHPTEPVTYIRTLDGRRFRWTNANFVALSWRTDSAQKQLESTDSDRNER